MATNLGTVFDKWIDLLKSQAALSAELATEVLTAVQGGASASGTRVLRFRVTSQQTHPAVPEDNPTIALPGVKKGHISASAGFHNHTGEGRILGERPKPREVRPQEWQFELESVAADKPPNGLYSGVILNSVTGDVIASVVIHVRP